MPNHDPLGPITLTLTGYLHPGYAAALAEFGTPVELPRSGGWLLKRSIPGTDAVDAMGCYPYLVCRDWSALAVDLEEIGRGLVSIAAAPDPFGSHTQEDLQRAFPDRVIHFKDHYLADLSQPADKIISKHHRQYAEKALRQVQVEFCDQPVKYLDPWMELFGAAVHKFKITGIRAFSRESFARQFALPGVVMSLSRHNGEIIAAHVQMIHGDTAYAHLAAANEASYKLGAAYALYHAEIHYYAGKVRRLDWGGEAGAVQKGNSLSTFKSGWSTGTRPAYFCGRIFDKDRYDQITRDKSITPGNYFPAYREGEFD